MSMLPIQETAERDENKSVTSHFVFVCVFVQVSRLHDPCAFGAWVRLGQASSRARSRVAMPGVSSDKVNCIPRALDYSESPVCSVAVERVLSSKSALISVQDVSGSLAILQ